MLALPFVLFGLLWINRIRRENKILEEKVAQRTQKIQVQNTQLAESLSALKTTQQQLILQEKMASLGQVTMGIAHEIKNPLNFVNNYAEVSVELADEL